MTTSSQPIPYLTTLDSQYTVNSNITSVDLSSMISTITINSTPNNVSFVTTTPTVTTAAGTTSTINWGTTNIYSYKEFVDTMPNMSKINDMCEKYPGFKIAFEKFKNTYNLIKDDYDAEKNKN